MKIETQGRMMNKSDFQVLWNNSVDLTFDPSSGLPLGKVSVSTGIGKGLSRYIFVKDDDTGATCCYRQSKYNSAWSDKAVSNAYFVRSANIDAANGVIEINNTAIGSVDGTNPIEAGKTDDLEKALIAMCDNTKNPNLSVVYDKIKKLFTAGIAGGVAPVVPPVSLADSDNVYLINLSPESRLAHPIKTIKKTRRVDTRVAWLVVGPHANAEKAALGKKSLYLLETLQDRDGKDIDITSSTSILNAGGKVVRRIRYDSKEMKIEYYKGADKRAYFAIRAEEEPSCNVKDWANKFGTGKDGFDNNKVIELKAMPKTYQGRRVLSCVLAGVVATTLLAGAVYHIYDAVRDGVNAENEAIAGIYQTIPDESAEAEKWGATQIQEMIAELDGNLLNYSNVGSNLGVNVTVGRIKDIDYGKIETYEQSMLGNYKGQIIGLDKYDYTLDTIKGAFEELGKQVADEASENGFVVAVRESENANTSIRYIYGSVDPLAPASALLNKENMEDYLEMEYADKYQDMGTSLESIVSTAVDAYESGYKTKATELAIENPDIVIDAGDIPVVDYEDPQLQSVIASKVATLTESAKKYSAEEINIAYSSYEEQVIFANTTDGMYLYKLDLTNGGKDISEIESNEDMIAKINNVDNCVESIQLDTLLKRLDLSKSIENLKNTYSNENGVSAPQFYVSGHIPTQSQDNLDKLEISPRITVVSNNGGRIEEKNYDTVRTNIGDGVAISEMVALSVFGDAVSNRYPNCERISRDAEAKVFENNDLTVDEGKALQENTVSTVVNNKNNAKDYGRTL